MSAHASREAEQGVVGAMLDRPACIPEVIGTQLAATDFAGADTRLLFTTVVESYYADQPLDVLLAAERLKPKLSAGWGVQEQEVVEELQRRLSPSPAPTLIAHAGLIKRLGTTRRLLRIVRDAEAALDSDRSPEEIAAQVSKEMLAATSESLAREQLYDWMDTGRGLVTHIRRLRLAREKGIELAVYTGLPCIDEYTKGISPTELAFIAGAPGVGKSIIGWKAAEGFAMRQLRKQPEHRIGTLIISMEMGLVPSSTRLAQSITQIDGARLREGTLTDGEYQKILREWKAREGLPIYFNYASNFRLSQLRALIVEAIRRFNVGFVIIDHFRQIDPDRRIENSNEADEVKARFLKEGLAKDLNLAVLCLAHTIKIGGGANENRRPRLSDLRGSGQIAANADFVGFLHAPGKDLTSEEQMTLGLSENDMEMLWAKARHTADGVARFWLDPSSMSVGMR